MGKAKGKQIRYFPLDHNYSMLSRAVQYVLPLISKDQYCNLELIAILGDFMKLQNYNPIIYNKPTPKLFGLLGSLIGNIDENRVLSGIRNFMHVSDVFILGADLIAGRTNSDLEKPYKQTEVKELMIFPLIEHLSTDPNYEDLIKNLKKAKINVKIEEGLIVPNSKKVQVSFVVKGKTYRHFFSTKYDLASLETYLEETVGFNILGKYYEFGKYENAKDIPKAKYAKFVLKK